MGAVRAIGAAGLIAMLALAPAPMAFSQDMESTVYSAANSCPALRSYLSAYPKGRYRADAEARIAKDCAAPKPAPSKAATPSPPADPCIRARADWPQISGSSDLNVLRAFLNQTPYECGVQRAQATTRISDVETAQRNAAAQALAAQQAEAKRVAAEQAAAQQRQATLNRSWTAIAVSDWGDYWGTGYVDYGGVTGQSSAQAASAAAIKACDDMGKGKNCRVEVGPFNSGCAAFAYKGSDLTEGMYRGRWAATEADAKYEAQKDCKSKGCEIKLSICARPG